ncbi:MAG: hypothetical protein K2I75_07910 [Clostridiales bacterium]|nr:hypothetical protein [Clostridiales bacterium]
MSVDIDAIRKYVMTFETVSFHTVQKQFSLSYCQVRDIFDQFVQDGIVEFESGFSYNVNKPQLLPVRAVKKRSYNLDEIDPTDELLLRAIWNCILTDNVSASGVQRRLSISYASAYGLVEKMNALGVIDYDARKVLVTAEEYIEKFGTALGLV